MTELVLRDSQTLTDPNPPAVGDVQFCDNYLPALKTGTYTIEMTQELKNVSPMQGNQQSLDETFRQNQQFSIVGSRFQVIGSDIQSVNPPDKNQGQFEQQLPFIVLDERALPWEYNLSDTAAATTPWVALLLFQQDDINVPSGNSSILTNPTLTSTYTVKQMTTSESGILKPALTLTNLDDPTALCRTIDITPATFSALVPTDSELAYLAHCRVVNLQDKEEGQASGNNGWYSVVMSNRLPQNDTDQPVYYIAHLVSLEGFGSYIQANQPKLIPSGTNYVRLISLTSWSFTCLPQPKEDFSSLMLNLVQGQAQGGAGLALQMPMTGSATTPDQQLAETIVNRGYVPLTYHVSTGEETYAWYRSPFCPVPVANFTPPAPYPAAEAALIYDQTTGVFDQSYAVAWQTGRLLALADRSFAVSLMNWRQQAAQTVQLLHTRLNSPHVDAKLKQTETIEQLRSLLHPKLISESFMTFLGDDFAKQTAKDVANLGTERSLPLKQNHQHQQSNSRSASKTSTATLKEFMQHPDMPSLLPKAIVARRQAAGARVGDDSPIPSDITDWLGKLALLYGVPFNVLVPNNVMLPSESIRFFYVDPNFIDGLIDGALSIGIQSSRDTQITQIMRSPVRAAVFQKAFLLRHRLVGTQPTDADGYTPTPPLAGFLLRSAAIAGWPGLEIKLYSDIAATQPITPARIQSITPDVLLCLCNTMPARIEFDEPQESLSFGVEAGNTISLRNIAGSSPGTPISGANVTAPFRSTSSDDVLDVGQLVSLLQTQLQSHGQLTGNLSPSQFAIQLVRSPEQMVFQNQP